MVRPPTAFFNCQDFLVDLVRELAARGHPRYPTRLWWRAFELADARDIARRVRALNDQLELSRSVVVVDFIEDCDAKRLVVVGYQIRTVEAPVASFDYEESKRRDLLAKRAYYYRNRRRVLDGKLAWQKRNREKVAAYARAYKARKGEERRQQAAEAVSLTPGVTMLGVES